jgi:23S rRNA (adenine2503-C2)-methyltransferase
MKDKLFGMTLPQLKEVVKQLGLPGFVATQIADWLYKKQITSIEQMSNLSLKARNLLSENYDLGLDAPIKEQLSKDGTKKYLYPAKAGKFIETAYIPDEHRSTLCVSSQVGCKMGCLFCMTGKQGFQGHLSVGEILNQLHSLPEREKITNMVYMGMGEPFDNLENVLTSLEILTAQWGYGMSSKRITVSSIGIIPGMKEFLRRSGCHLAISLHTPFDDERKQLMPIQNVYPIKDVLDEIRTYPLEPQRRISFEYIMFKGVNDFPRHVKELTRILSGIECRINLIRFHPIPGTPLEGSDEATIAQFNQALNQKGIITTTRASRGLDIYAACGMLSTKELVKKDDID